MSSASASSDYSRSQSETSSSGSAYRIAAQIASRSREMMCTHITMVRMYADDMRCSMCLQPGPFGWLYRCTQDRELMIEEDYIEGDKNAFDGLFDAFTVPITPKKRTAAARANPVSFLDEMTSEQLKTYTPQQISMLFRQRTHALDVAKRHAKDNEIRRQRELNLFGLPSSLIPGTNVMNPEGDTFENDTHWLPKPHDECQFKVCHNCRHGSAERAFLCLDGIANDEIPMTAVSGFGFNLHGKRPAILRKHAINFGLRPSPNPQTPTTMHREKGLGIGGSPLSPDATSDRVSSEQSPFDDGQDADTTFGQSSHAYDSAAMTRSLNVESSDLAKINPMSTTERTKLRRILKVNVALAAQNASVEPAEQNSLLSHIRAADTPPNSPRQSEPGEDTRRCNRPGVVRGRSDKSLLTNPELRRQFNLDDIADDTDDTNDEPENDAVTSRDAAANMPSLSTLTLQSDDLTTVPLVATNCPATAMELHERRAQEFGSGPLEVKNGVAVTEEAVELHLADMVTQY